MKETASLVAWLRLAYRFFRASAVWEGSRVVTAAIPASSR